MSNKPSASKIDTVIKLILIFFITLLSFSVGTFVGKQVSDSEYRKAAIEGDYDYFNADKTDAESSDEEGLTNEDLETLTAEFVKSEKREIASAKKDEAPAKKENKEAKGYKKFVKSAQRPQPKAEVKKAAPKKKVAAAKPAPKVEKKAKAVSKAAKRVAQNKAPAKAPVQKRKPTSVLPSVASSAVGKYTVQVASYADEKEAKGHSAKLKEKGWNAFYVPADVRGRTWFRVSVGLFSTSQSAEKFKRELVKDNAVNSAYVQRIVK